MPDYQNIISKSARITFPTDDGDLHLDYYPGRITLRLNAKLDAFRKQDPETVAHDQFYEMCTILVGLIEDWDLMNGKEKYPLDADHMMDLPISVIQSLVGGMLGPN